MKTGEVSVQQTPLEAHSVSGDTAPVITECHPGRPWRRDGRHITSLLRRPKAQIIITWRIERTFNL